MAARLPQSATSIAYRIKPAYASKVLAVFWPASADAVHRLRSADTATTIVTRTAGGAGFDAATGFITGTSTTSFTDSIAGGYTGSTQKDNTTLGISYFGDIFNGVPPTRALTTAQLPNSSAAIEIYFDGYAGVQCVQGGATNGLGLAIADDVDAFITVALRNNQADATAKQRIWGNGAEFTGLRANVVPASTAVIGDTATPLYFGQTAAGTGNTKLNFELVFLGTGALTDADLAAITADPSIMIEVTPAGTVPGAPTIGTVTAGNASASVPFTDGTAGSSVTTSYIVTPYIGATAQTTVTGTSSPIAVTGLTNGTAYTFKVAAINSVGTGAQSAASNSVTPAASGDTTPPTMTGTLTVSGITSSGCTVDWSGTARADNVAVTGYEYNISGGAYADAGTALSHAFTGLAPSTSYTVTVRAYDAAGNRSTPALSVVATTSATAVGTLTTSPLKNNTGTLLASLTGITALVYDLITGALVVKKTAQTTSSTGVMVVTDATIVPATQYRLIIVLGTAAEGMDKVTAT